jgi:ABC-type sulfate transport system permease component
VITVLIILVWTRPLASGVKSAVTIALVLVAATCGVGYVIHRVITASRDRGSSGSSYSRSLVDD